MKRFVLFSPVYWLALAALTAGALIGDDAPWWAYTLACFGAAAVTDALERRYVTSRAARLKVITAFCANCKTVSGHVEHEEISNSTLPKLPRLCVHAPWAGGCTRPECR